MFEEFWKAVIDLVSHISQALTSAHAADDALLYSIKVAGGVLGLAAAMLSAFYWGRRVLKERIQQVLVDPDQFWSKAASELDRGRYLKKITSSIPIIAVANYKGGVGKSMISANLAAYFDKIGLRVLLIDFDYQGSLTDIVPYRDPDHLTFSAHDVLSGTKASTRLRNPQELGRSFRFARIHPAESELSRIDSSLIYRWLIGDLKEDIRFNTHRYLSSAFVQKNFDIVIIDTPPRICAATANALCAATAVIVPTILDTVSSRAVFRSIEMFLNFRDRLGLAFRILGVVPSKVEAQTRYNDRESKALAYLKDELYGRYKTRVNRATRRIEPVRVLDQLPIMHKVSLLHMEGDDLVVLKPNPNRNDAVVQTMFASLGNFVLQEVGIKPQDAMEERDEGIRASQDVIELRASARSSAGARGA